MTASTFNPIEHMNGAIKVGFTREQAEYQATEWAKVVNNDLVTKSYLSNELKILKIELQGFIVKSLITVVGVLGGLQTILHFT